MDVLDENLILAIKQQKGFNLNYLRYRKRIKWNISLNLLWLFFLILSIFYCIYTFFPLNVLGGWPIYLMLVFCFFFLTEVINKLRKYLKEFQKPTIHVEEDLFLALKPSKKPSTQNQYYVELEHLGDCSIEQTKIRSLPSKTPVYIVKWGENDEIVEIYTKEEIHIN